MFLFFCQSEGQEFCMVAKLKKRLLLLTHNIFFSQHGSPQTVSCKSGQRLCAVVMFNVSFNSSTGHLNPGLQQLRPRQLRG